MLKSFGCFFLKGNKAEVGPGGIQAFNAGLGITHSEKPGEEGLSHGIQLWINLPRDEKEAGPSYQKLNISIFGPKMIVNLHRNCPKIK